jgi:hypothetical protein
MATVAIQVGKEVLVSGPLTVFVVNTVVPRFLAPVIKLLQSKHPMVPHAGVLSVRIVDAFRRDIELRAAAAKLLWKSGEFNYIGFEKLAAKLGVDPKRWRSEEIRREREIAEAAAVRRSEEMRREREIAEAAAVPKITNLIPSALSLTVLPQNCAGRAGRGPSDSSREKREGRLERIVYL